jgi:hypothetical protein
VPLLLRLFPATAVPPHRPLSALLPALHEVPFFRPPRLVVSAALQTGFFSDPSGLEPLPSLLPAEGGAKASETCQFYMAESLLLLQHLHAEGLGCSLSRPESFTVAPSSHLSVCMFSFLDASHTAVTDLRALGRGLHSLIAYLLLLPSPLPFSAALLAFVKEVACTDMLKS